MTQTAATPFGVLLRQHRLSAGLTQEQLAERAQVSARVISDLERLDGRAPRSHTVRQLLTALPLSPEDRHALLVASHNNVARRAWDRESVDLDHPLPAGGFLGARPSGPLVAREADVSRLLASIDTVGAGQGRVIALTGEAGVGKTRLAQEVSLIAQDRGFLVAAGSCYETQQTTAFFPFLDILTSLYRAAPGDIRAVVPQQFPHLPTLLLDHQLPLPSAVQHGAEGQERLFWSVATFIQACAAQHPVALLVDDLQWADSSSLELLQRLGRQTRGHAVLMLVTYRDVEVGQQHRLEATLGELTRQDLLTRMPVRPLREDETAQLVATVFDEQEISAEFASLLYERTDGNPFLVQQVLQVLVERGDVYREEGRWTRKAIGELGVPESIRSAVGQRVARLSEPAQRMLGKASVLGQNFFFDDLAAMGDLDEAAVEGALSEVLGVGLIRELSADQYAFDHGLTQQVLYEELTTRRRRRLHLAAGKALEQLPERWRTQRVAELAWHFQHGDDPARALPYVLQAGEQAEGIYAYGEAERQYRTARELAQEVEDRQVEAEAGEQLAYVLGHLNRWSEAVLVSEGALTRYHELEDIEGEMRAVRIMGYAWPPHRVEEIIPRLERLLKRAPRTPSPARARLVALLAGAYMFAGQVSEAISLAREAIILAEASDDGQAQLDALHALGSAYDESGQPDEALAAYETLGRVAERRNDTYYLAISLIHLGWRHHLQRKFDLAVQTTRQGLDVARRSGSVNGITWATVNLGEIAFDVGEWVEAERWFTEAVPFGRMPATTTDPTPNLLYLRLLKGDKSALTDLTRLADDPTSWAARYLAEWELVTGYPAPAQKRMESALEAGIAAIYRRGWIALSAEISLVLGGLERAEALLGPVADQPARSGYPADPIHCKRVMGMLRAAQGRWVEAHMYFERALDESEGFPFVQAQVHHAWGQAQGRNEYAAARVHLEAALTLFNRLGASVYATRTEAVLRTLDLQ